jgi:hypothetical protein
MKKIILFLTLFMAFCNADNCFKLQPECKGSYQNKYSSEKCYAQNKYSSSDNYYQTKYSSAKCYLQDKYTQKAGYIQDKYTQNAGYVKDKTFFGFSND